MIKQVTLNEALDMYYVEKLSGMKPSSKATNESQLERWRSWVTMNTQSNVYLLDIDSTMMARYFNKHRPPDYQESTFNAYRQIVMSFWEYCIGEGWCRVNPMRHIDPMRVPEKARLRLSAGELQEILEGADHPRDRIGLATGMNTGLRGGDAARLKIGDINLRNNLIPIQIQKTGRRDEIPITAEYRAELLRWFEDYAQLTGHGGIGELPNTYSLIPTMQGMAAPGGTYIVRVMPLRVMSQPHRIVHRALEKMGLPSFGEGFHTLRRSAGRVFYDQACANGHPNPLRATQAFLGHKNQKTTELYIGIDLDKRDRDEMLQGKSFLTVAADRERDANQLLDAEHQGNIHRTEATDLRRRRSA